jgi:hypothetical protein
MLPIDHLKGPIRVTSNVMVFVSGLASENEPCRHSDARFMRTGMERAFNAWF